MREILFRGKSRKTGEWIYGYLVDSIEYETERPVVAIVESDSLLFPMSRMVGYTEVDPDTVGQYIGMSDLYGSKIFEGDILESPVKVFNKLHGNGTRLVITEIRNCRNVVWCAQDFSIVGNIHDNPELLEA